MRRILIEELRQVPVAEHKVEIVERKGTGHPDYICDAIMERVSQDLNREYLDRFGDILHNNVDKGLLVAGQVKRAFGGGKVLKPMRLYIGDRATFALGEAKVPVREIAVEAAKAWIRENLRFVDPEKHLRIQVVLGPGSEELTDIFQRQGGLREANDTSAAVGYAPLSETERMVLEAERYLNSPAFKGRFPESGEDVKVMGFREGRCLHLTVAMPLLCRYIETESAYVQKKAAILEDLGRCFGSTPGLDEVTFSLNALDRQGRGMGGMYLSLLGTSAEDADSGQVGRGNRVNGVIPLNRPVSAEAAAGKNPVSHVGKIYNILAHRMAEAIYLRVKGLQEVYVWLLSQIGTPIDQPRMATQLILESGVTLNAIAHQVQEVIEEELSNLAQFCRDLALGRYSVC
ncbi:MAG: methionine adenosyltransferase [candidate division NC10 bacterium]|nr:methionine adenosyltransferase [candidate division NC10 bacterium]